MDEIYPPESQKLDMIGHLEELRRRIGICLACLILISVYAFAKGESLLWLAKRPAESFLGELIFITPTEVFVSYIKISILFGFMICFPIFLFEAWLFLAPAVTRKKHTNIILWIIFAFISFIVGILFSYFVALPAALKFLLSFGGGVAVPKITLSKYISFFTAFILIGGTVFEIPIIIALLSDIGLLKTRTLKEKRKYALVIMLIIAAVITPTQDIFNMMMFALPMVLLYEVGIMIAAMIERRKKKS